MLCNNFKAQYSHFLHRRKPNVRHLRKTNVNKRFLFLALSKILLFSFSACGSEVIAYRLNGKKTLISDFT